MDININQKIIEFTNNGECYGLYLATFGTRDNRVILRNGESVGVVEFLVGKKATNCIGEMREDVKIKFLKILEESND